MSSFFLTVPAKKCQLARDWLRRERLLDKGGQRLDERSDFVVSVPVRIDEGEVGEVLRRLSDHIGLAVNEVEAVPRCNKASGRKVENAYKRMCSVCKEILLKHDLWTDDLEAEVPAQWEKHNDLALFAESAFKSDKWFSLSVRDELWPAISRILCVDRLARKSLISDNDFRSPRVEIFFGDRDNTWVSRKENGIVYNWDVTRSMFSAGNISEKLRIAKFDCQNEVVVDLFAGIGYFTLPFLVHAGALHVHACEWNPAAVEALTKNLKVNQVEDRCTVYPGDNRIVCPRNVADRVNLGLLPTAEMSYSTACATLKRDTGGILHIHENVRTERSEPEVEPADRLSVGEGFRCDNPSWRRWCFKTAATVKAIFAEIYPERDWSCLLVHLERVKSFAPHVDHLVLDLKCSPFPCQ